MPQIKKKFIENNSIDNTKLDQSSEYDFATNNGIIKVNEPENEYEAANKSYVDNIIQRIRMQELESLIYTDTENKVIALEHIPSNFEDVLLFSYTGRIQKYGIDFAISVKDNVAYICLANDSTSPDGIWDIENLPSVGVLRISDLTYGFVCKYYY